MRFGTSFLDEIRARVTISDVVGRRVTWDRRKSAPQRGDYWACCPFHGEKTPSFHADDRKGLYYCFGCGAKGDHFRFLVEQEGMTFPQAVETLAREAGLPMPERDPEAEKKEKAREGLVEVLEAAARFFEDALQGPNGAKARSYLRERGLETARARFRIGYAPDARNALKEHLAARGFSHAAMVEAGLLVAGDDIPVSYDRFRDRVIFPIHDMRGRVIAFGGRALSSDVPAKYLNSPETPLFHKGDILFNGREAAGRAGRIVAVEGYTDVIACVTAGFEPVVAPLGTALTEAQLRALWRMSDEPVLCFDGDGAGLKAAHRALDLALPLLQPGKTLRFALLPEGRDPDDLVRGDGIAAFERVIERARSLVDLLWQRETEGRSLDTPERRAALEGDIRRLVRTIAEESVRRHYEVALRDRLEGLLGTPGGNSPSRRQKGARVRGGAAAPSIGVSNSHLAVKSGDDGIHLRDAILLGPLVAHPSHAAERIEQIGDLEFASPSARKFAQSLVSALMEEPDAPTRDLQEMLCRMGHERALEQVTTKLALAGMRELLPGGDAGRAMEAWESAALLRGRHATLSREREAVARELVEHSDEGWLARLRDLQAQQERVSMLEESSGPAEIVIENPLRRRTR